MKSRISLLVALLVLTPLLAACGTHRTVVHRHGHARVVVVDKKHKHTARCGHYRHAGKWYHVKGHVHGKKCGHKLHKGVWVIH